MLVRNRELLQLLGRAEQEIAEWRREVPPPSFHHRKLHEVWDRARRSPAYRGLGDWSPEAFDALPVLAKDELKRQPWEFATVDAGGAAKYYETTGTTGNATATPRLAQDVIWNAVSVGTAWDGLVEPGDRVLVMLPSDVVPVADLVVGVCEYRGVPHLRAYPFATGITDWDRLIGLLEGFRPTVLFVAPGVLVQFTRLLKQRGRLADLAGPVRSLMLLGEVSTPAMRGRLGQWWQARAYDASYGSTETGTLAATCPDGGQHLLTTTNHFELRTDAGVGPLPGPGGTAEGSLVVTPLNLYARPLLRLDTGDRVDVGGSCPCGSGLPLVSVHGRDSDSLTLRGADLTPRAVEEVVFGASAATGYLVELDPDGHFGRLLLERDVDADRGTEPAQRDAVQAASRYRLGVSWDEVVFLNTLVASTKARAAQKSWKRSNVRLLERTR